MSLSFLTPFSAVSGIPPRADPALISARTESSAWHLEMSERASGLGVQWLAFHTLFDNEL